ncbi:hypothetical protein [Sinomonas humi]|uniref:Uncharacterized protein n=1 Tax=Sinomonas humi TaxID=1338436 RepID=A0A0B2ARC5_9MICC|nr:hypothetical protein [Sinomonas humi]KHL04423.1 hypothetical protein LK10_05945 [Sinomonas humi]
MTEESPRGPRVGIKGPLMFSAFFGVLSFVAVLFFASGGTGHGMRFDLAFAGGGIAFIACLVGAAMLSMTYKENPEHLSQGSGVNLRSEDRLKRPKPQTGPAPEGSATVDGDTTGDNTNESGGAA